jgi:hypothetical protein
VQASPQAERGTGRPRRSIAPTLGYSALVTVTRTAPVRPYLQGPSAVPGDELFNHLII